MRLLAAGRSFLAGRQGVRVNVKSKVRAPPEYLSLINVSFVVVNYHRAHPLLYTMTNPSILSKPKGAGYSIDFSQEGEPPTCTLTRAASRGFDDTQASEATAIQITDAMSGYLNSKIAPAIAISEACLGRATPESFCNGTIYLTRIGSERW
jgi:hypothetical protein